MYKLIKNNYFKSMNQHIKDIEAQFQEIDLTQLYDIRSVLELEIDRKETIYRDEGICFECGTKMVEERECDEKTGYNHIISTYCPTCGY